VKYDAYIHGAYDTIFWLFWMMVVLVVVVLWLPVYVLIALYEDLAADRRRP
jgi:heme/copper-type cytochrome/quinol oxidase subunit 2